MSKRVADERPEALKDLSRPVSPAADNESLDEELPTYEGSQAGSPLQPPISEKSAVRTGLPSAVPSGTQFVRPQPRSSPPAEQSRQQPSSRPTQTLQPTASSPFRFPTDAPPPSYDELEPINRPLAIPQTNAKPAAPLIEAYPVALLSFGITPESWSAFATTLSAFLSADISKQALHHATDVANSIGKLIPKRFIKPTMDQVSQIEQSARNLNPFGVVRGTVRLTVGTAFRIVGTLLPVHNELWRKPNTPRARAEVYVATANKDWFNSRGLHAWLLDTNELTELIGLDKGDLLEAAAHSGSQDAEAQMDALRDVLGDLLFDDVNKNETDSTAGASSSSAKKQTLQLGPTSLWLVLSREGSFQGMNGEYMAKGRSQR